MHVEPFCLSSPAYLSAIPCGVRDQYRLPDLRHGAKSNGHREAIDPRHTKIKQYDLWNEVNGCLDTFSTAAGDEGGMTVQFK
jgi:hypothetical protein